jgi:hypothetical protein
MKKLIRYLSGTLLSLCFFEVRADMNELTSPAVIVLHASSATVMVTDKHQKVLTLSVVDKLVSTASNLGKHRKFYAFHIADFAESWNNCNIMKEAKDWFNVDGTNALVGFTLGPDNGESYRRYSPLATSAHKGDESRIDDRAGTLRLMLRDAVYDATQGTLSFKIKDGRATVGKYESVSMLTECME